jgi:transcriptional regulator of acetoin/glycerol metabolism
MLPAPTGAMLRQARQALIEHGAAPSAELVGQTVARSWLRCLDAGMAPIGRLPDAPDIDSFQFAQVTDRHHDLMTHARPVIEYLHAQTRGSGSLVLLADDRGVVLQTMGDLDFLSRAERVALMPGTSWHERHRGTNAIGTALAEACPVAIHGAEHYLDRNGFLTCAAAPVAAPDGRLLGVLDISGDQRGRHPHTFGLVRAAAQMIENRLFDARHGDALRLRFHPLAEGIGTVAEGVVALSDDGWIVGANQSALSLLCLCPADLGATPISRVLQVNPAALVEWGNRRGSESMPVIRRDGDRLFVRVDVGRTPCRVFAAPALDARQDALASLDAGDIRLKAAIDKARRVIGKPIALLLQGESGAGKEFLAKAFHDSGPRRGKPFVAVNCATLPENLIEAELFGYVPGAYTGARKEGSPGRIREANGGTLFLDEIGDMPPAQQARLLRVLQEREVQPVGGGKAVGIDFSLVCATHHDLKTEMEQGRFRADLYYRINGLTLMLPALRERSDFAALTSRMLTEMAPDKNLALDDKVMSSFVAYAWPGNLRQLANALRTACAMLDDDETHIDWQHLPDDLVEELRRASFRAALAAPEKTLVGESLQELSAAAIDRTIVACHGNLSETARRLGISRNTLYRRLKKTHSQR